MHACNCSVGRHFVLSIYYTHNDGRCVGSSVVQSSLGGEGGGNF